jgi:uncharacterized membrane protein YkvA (DUF1232 family)
MPVNVDRFHGTPTQVGSNNWLFAVTPYRGLTQRPDALLSDQSIVISEVTSQQDSSEEAAKWVWRLDPKVIYQKRTVMLEGEFDNSIVPDTSPHVRRVRGVKRLPRRIAVWGEKAQKLQKQAHVFYFAFKHPKTPWYARLIAACAAGYLLSPIQLIPSFIPVIGFMDDLVVLVIGFKLIQRAMPPEVLQECRDLAEAAEVQRKTEVRSLTRFAVFIAIAGLWLILAITGSLLVASHFRHR